MRLKPYITSIKEKSSYLMRLQMVPTLKKSKASMFLFGYMMEQQILIWHTTGQGQTLILQGDTM